MIKLKKFLNAFALFAFALALLLPGGAVRAIVATEYSPKNNASDVAIDTNLVITFNENIAVDSGSVTIKKISDDSTVQTIDVNSNNVSVSDKVATISINDLEYNTDYYVNIDSGAFKNANDSNDGFAGINDDLTWNFTTKSDPNAGAMKAGTVCQTDADCAGSNLDCKDNCCVPVPSVRKIGTWCKEVWHCETGSGQLDLTCGPNDYCVGSVAGVSCLDEDVNTDSTLGYNSDDVPYYERCDTGLVCDQEKGRCENDFGQGKVPSDKLGDASKDIRDQIRSWKS